jgi:glycosyltransferase involved in cell wall biosynthesis
VKVLFITREGYHSAGARVRCYHFARELERRGIPSAVFSLADHLGAKEGEKELEMSLGRKLVLSYRAFRVLIKEDKDTIFVIQRLNYHSLAPLSVALFNGNRIIFDCDDWNIRENPVYYFGLYPSSWMEYLTRLLARRADACIAASRYLQEYLGRFAKRVAYIPTGVDADFFSPRDRDSDGRVVFSWIGTAYHADMGENLRFVLECFERVADRLDFVYLSLAGEGRYFEEARVIAGASRHAARIVFCSWIKPEQMPDHLSGIDIGLLPLIQNTRFNRAKSPTKLFEYMSMARPVIASDRGEASHVVINGNTGFLAAGREDFMVHMYELATDSPLRKKIGCAARDVVQKSFGLDVIGASLARVVKDI